jgi:hypothetical protein
MSIIQEALRKAQGRHAENKKGAPPPEAGAPLAASKEVLKPAEQVPSHAAAHRARIFLSVIAAVLFAVVLKQTLFDKGPSPALKEGRPSYQEVKYKNIEPEKETGKMEESVTEKAAAAFPKPEHFGLKPAAPDLVLNGIMYLPSHPQAIINNSVVTEGDTVSGAVVKRISRNSVVLEYDKLEITLNLKAG